MRARHLANLIGRSSITDPRWQIAFYREIDRKRKIDSPSRLSILPIARNPRASPFLRNRPIYLSGVLVNEPESGPVTTPVESYRHAKFYDRGSFFEIRDRLVSDFERI